MLFLDSIEIYYFLCKFISCIKILRAPRNLRDLLFYGHRAENFLIFAQFPLKQFTGFKLSIIVINREILSSIANFDFSFKGSNPIHSNS